MIKMDVNGNTVSKNRAYCLKQIREKLVSVDIDSVQRVMVNLADGGSVRFFAEDEYLVCLNIGLYAV